LPLVFAVESDYDNCWKGDELELPNIRQEIFEGTSITVYNKTKGHRFSTILELSDRLKKIILAGGVLASLK